MKNGRSPDPNVIQGGKTMLRTCAEKGDMFWNSGRILADIDN